MDTQGNVIPVAIEDEIKESYLNYAMSVIVSRALPDVRDGLKPVHRRILHAMNELGMRADRPFKKCGLIVGDVLGKFHPHGDQSIYDALVRLAQDFSMRYPVIKPQGNFGSVDGDPPAAYRYTEAKMNKLAQEMLNDIRKETVDFRPNYDDSRKEPAVLPSAIPYLLINGGSGIAVGMATNMAPHNLTEVCSAIEAYIDDPDISIYGLMEHISGPDFPTGGIIYGVSGIKQAYLTGRGKITVRGKFVLETTKSGKDVIVFTELPYQVNKANLIARIADHVREKKIDGISDMRDESDRNGMRIVIILKKGAIPKIVLNRLFAHSALQQNFNVNNLALVDGIPKLLNLKNMIHYYVEHRKDVVTRRTKFELQKAEERAHILEGLKIALDNIDEVIKTIKESKNVETARNRLMDKFSLSERQSQAILDMRLQKLTSLETQKIIDELEEIRKLIEHLKDLLANVDKLLRVVKDEIKEICEKYGDERRTRIVQEEVGQVNIEDLIKKEDMVVLISNKGFIKRVPVSAYKIQGRGGKGSKSTILKNEDFVEHLFIASTHKFIFFVTSAGKAYYLKVHEIPEATRASRGTSIKTLFPITADEEITTFVTLDKFSEDTFLFMATRKGIVKKVRTSDFINAKTRGIRAIKLDDGDKLVSALLTTGENEIVLVSRKGNALRCNEKNIRSIGRVSRGVIGLRLSTEDELASVLTVKNEEQMLILTEYGYGKRIEYDNFTPHGRGTRGQIAYKTSDKTGQIIGAITINNEYELVCITSQGKTIKLEAKYVPVLGKNAMGVKIVQISRPDFLIGIAKVISEDKNETDGDENPEEASSDSLDE